MKYSIVIDEVDESFDGVMYDEGENEQITGDSPTAFHREAAGEGRLDPAGIFLPVRFGLLEAFHSIASFTVSSAVTLR